MEVVKIVLPMQREPEFYCPFTGHNLLGEGLQDAVDDGYLALAINWENADDFVLASDDFVEKYQSFVYTGDGDPTDRAVAFMKSIGKEDETFIIELEVNAVGCGPICDCNTYVFWK